MSLVNPAGPTFVSYRWADGSGYALDAARRLPAGRGGPCRQGRTRSPA